MLSEARLYGLLSLAKYICAKDICGNFVECGVAAGTILLTVLAACDLLRVNGFFVRDYLIDDNFLGPFTAENQLWTYTHCREYTSRAILKPA